VLKRINFSKVVICGVMKRKVGWETKKKRALEKIQS